MSAKIKDAISKLLDVQRVVALTLARAAGDAPAGGKKGVRTFIVQTEAPATDGGIIRTLGADYSYFEPRRSILFGHDDGSGNMVARGGPLSGIPIGSMVARRTVDGIEVPGVDRKVSGTEWDIMPAHEMPAMASDESEVARAMRTIWNLVDAGALRSFSLRFKPLHLEDVDEQGLIDLGLSPMWGWVADKWRITEGSVLACGADFGALARAYQTPGVDRSALVSIFPEPQIVVRGNAPATPAEPPAQERPAWVDDLRAAIEANTRAVSDLTRTNGALVDVVDELRSELSEPTAAATPSPTGAIAPDADEEDARAIMAGLETVTRNATAIAGRIAGKTK